MDRKQEALVATDLDALVRRVRMEAANLTGLDDNQSRGRSPATSFSEAIDASDNADLIANPSCLSLLRLYAIEPGQVVDELYRILLGREPDSQGKYVYERMLQETGSRMRVALELRYSPEGRQKAVPLEAARRTRIGYVMSSVLRRIGFKGVARRWSHCIDESQRSRWGWSATLVRRLRRVEQYAEGIQTALHQESDSGDELIAQEIDKYYLAFEEDGRGSFDALRIKLTAYDQWLRDIAVTTPLPVLDLGCGRGEWLGILKEQGIQAWGIDLNPLMVEACQQKGLDAECGDALKILGALDDASLGAITMFHIVEHLPFPTLYRLIRESVRVLNPGGAILIETPNPENLLVGSHTFYHDFTHRNPVTPTALQFLLTYHGFQHLQILRLNPYPAEAKVPGDDPLTERVNGHLCGPQDYAVLGWLPDREPKDA